MSGVLDTIFGTPSESSSESIPQDLLQKPIRKLARPTAKSLEQLGTFGGTPQFNPSEQSSEALSAPLGGNEQLLLDALLEDAQGGSGRQDLLEKTLGGFFTPGQPGFQGDILQAAIENAQRPTKNALIEVLERSLPGRFTAGGQFIQPGGSSAFDRAAALATRGAGETLAGIASDFSFRNLEAERGRQQEAIKLSQEEVNTTIQNLGAQALPRLIEDLGIERAQQVFRDRLQAVLSALQSSVAATRPASAQRFESTETGSTPGIFSQLFPKGLGGGSLPVPGA